MNKIWIIITCLITSITYSAQLYIKNWATTPIIITKLSIIRNHMADEVKTNIDIQPGHSTKIHYNTDGQTDNNFDKATITFKSAGYNKSEDIFFPNQADQTVSLSFTDAGYTRFPFDIVEVLQ